jgi:hypothetical protein
MKTAPFSQQPEAIKFEIGILNLKNTALNDLTYVAYAMDLL